MFCFPNSISLQNIADRTSATVTTNKPRSDNNEQRESSRSEGYNQDQNYLVITYNIIKSPLSPKLKTPTGRMLGQDGSVGRI